MNFNRSGNTVEIYLTGGLGNQLFGWAAGYALAKRLNVDLVLNTSNLWHRGYQLDSFGDINFQISKKRHSYYEYSKPFEHRLISTIYKKTDFFQRGFGFDSRFSRISKPVGIHGFFQSHLYFQQEISSIRGILEKLRNPSQSYLDLSNLLSDINFTAIHVRRGDYVGKENHHGLLEDDYYRRAMGLVESGSSSEMLVVFTDDENASKKLIPDADLYVTNEILESPAENLLIMSSAKKILGANSSFSLWAGFLAAEDAVRIFPKPWFSREIPGEQNLMPSEYIRIAARS
jgi:hypothetical protein